MPIILMGDIAAPEDRPNSNGKTPLAFPGLDGFMFKT
jgi:hypothetical protein